MLTVFNRSEVLFTFSQEEQFSACRKLSKRGIENAVKVRNRINSISAGGMFPDPRFSVEYKVYVHKDDLELAVAVIDGRLDD